ncbi:hypothetical protein RSAG8_09569, partial [Rhizoctonia solani AG-8 WAC10335]
MDSVHVRICSTDWAWVSESTRDTTLQKLHWYTRIVGNAGCGHGGAHLDRHPTDVSRICALGNTPSHLPTHHIQNQNTIQYSKIAALFADMINSYVVATTVDQKLGVCSAIILAAALALSTRVRNSRYL